MTSFAQKCGLHNAARHSALERTATLIEATDVELVRFAWCDLHGMLRCKTIVASKAIRAMMNGVGMVGTLLLKDSADRTAFPVFDEKANFHLPGFEGAGNVMLLADPASYQQLPWASKTGWVQCQAWHANQEHVEQQVGEPVAFDTRWVLQTALAKLSAAGYGMTCGLEVEFHIYKLPEDATSSQFDPMQANWPGPAPCVSMVHPGYQLLSEQWADMADAPLRIVQHTAQALGLPLVSLEIELGPSQFEAVFEPTDALQAADNMVLFRSAVKQALRRAGYHATFMCRPPFPHIMSSGWHLHQSLTTMGTGTNAFMRDAPLPGSTPDQAQHTLSPAGEQFLAGLLGHAHGMTAFSTPTINGYGRFQPNALAPQAAVWGRDNRGAMLRVMGGAKDNATRIENRIGEPAANPYLYIASQIYAGLDGIQRQLTAPPATASPYATGDVQLPGDLGAALQALANDAAFATAFSTEFIDYYTRIKQLEITRYEAAVDNCEWQRREYFGRI